MGAADEFDVLPDIDANVPAADLDSWSLAPSSADAQLAADLRDQKQLRRVAERKTKEIRQRCKMLERKLTMQARKQKRDAAIRKQRAAAAAAASAAHVSNRPSKASAKSHSNAHPLRDVTATQDLSDASPELSDDMLPAPEQHAKQPTFEDLNSVICEYKMQRIKPSFDGDISFKICAELAEEEAHFITKWNIHEKKHRMPMIISALRLLYDKKPNTWFDAWWARGPEEVADFWSQILERRAELWRRQHKKAKRKLDATTLAEATFSPTQSVKHRLQQRIKKRKLKLSSKAQKNAGKKSSPIVVRDTDDSDSSASSSDAGRHAPGSASEPQEKEEKLAPGPETYTQAEIKAFSKMAAAIEEVDESKGHSTAVADFIDSEFSDNSGMMVNAKRASKGSWKKGRFTRACEKAGKIMEERSVSRHLSPC